jgi:hypothetical protein
MTCESLGSFVVHVIVAAENVIEDVVMSEITGAVASLPVTTLSPTGAEGA